MPRSRAGRARRSRLDAVLLTVAVLSAAAGVSVAASNLVELPSVGHPVEVRAIFPTLDTVDTVVPAVVAERLVPLTLTIDGVDLWAPVRPVGLDPTGNLEIPSETEVGWYELGGSPGSGGATVLVGHVSWNNTFGPFYRLTELEEGAQVEIRLADGTVRSYSVVEQMMYAKDELPADRIWRSGGNEGLVLITCGGDFDGGIQRYRENVVVYAVPTV